MQSSNVNHLLTGEELSAYDIHNIMNIAKKIKEYPDMYMRELSGKHVVLSFEKPSLRTRMSFSVGIEKLGGSVIESVASTRKSEAPKDFIRVVQGYCDAIMIRTHAEAALFEMKKYATIPIINGLSESFHPCQALADLLTLQETFKKLHKVNLAYIGDGNNVLQSLIQMAPKVGVSIHYCCPQGFHPDLSHCDNEYKDRVHAYETVQEAVANCDAVYTDVWSSMGCESVAEEKFSGFQVNEALLSCAKDDAAFMHCMPMQRGKEVSESLPDHPRSLIFSQSKNRLFVQQALLITLMNQGK